MHPVFPKHSLLAALKYFTLSFKALIASIKLRHAVDIDSRA
jgi:hypothetical protein